MKTLKICCICLAMALFCLSANAGTRPILYKFDVTKLLAEGTELEYKYDQLVFVVSLQGLVNRTENRLYLNYGRNDQLWFDYIAQQSTMFKNQKVSVLNSFDELLKVFAKDVKGIVLWDHLVPATSNVAATICGVEGWIPVRKNTAPGSLYSKTVLAGYQFPVKKDLSGMFTGKGLIPGSRTKSSGSRKCDAYIWAKQQYLDKGLCNDSVMGYILDSWAYTKPYQIGTLENSMLVNHDYLIAKKAFFFDLSPWGDETPVDEKDQPMGADLQTFKQLLLAQYKNNHGRKIHTICGFTPWHLKYTTTRNAGKHQGVPTEWEQVEIQSAFNAVIDADAPSPMDLANASIYSKFPLKKKYNQNIDKNPKVKHLENKNYILIFMGDWDGSAWMADVIPKLWADKGRGEIPLMWSFNVNLSDRIPMVFDWIYRNRTTNDYIASGASGAGYLNPSFLLAGQRKHSSLPSGMNVWVKHNQYYFNKFDLSTVGFVINGRAPINAQVQQAYTHFASTGVGYLPYSKGIAVVAGGVPFITQSADLPRDLKQATQVIYADTKELQIGAEKLNAPQFHLYRAIRYPPSQIKQVIDKIKTEKPECNYELVDPYTFFYLLKKYALESGKPLEEMTNYSYGPYTNQ